MAGSAADADADADASASARPLRVALLGYGLAGRVFHAPLLRATPGVDLAYVVTSDPGRAAEAAALPGVAVLADADEVWARADELDLVVVGTANVAHVPQARAALEAGLSVVVDKPLAATSAQAQALVDLAAVSPGQLHVFQNRRWDSDALTVRRLAREGALGRVHRFESRFERWRPDIVGTWRDSGRPEEVPGLLYDLGAHLVDQALLLLGPVESVYASVRSVRGDGTGPDDDTQVVLRHTSGAVSMLWASAVSAFTTPRLRVLGADGGYEVDALDSQEDVLRRLVADGGQLPGDDWGVEAEQAWGRLVGRDGSVAVVPSERGAWTSYYPGVVAAVRDGGPPPVDPRDVVADLRVIEAAAESGRSGAAVVLDPPAAHSD